MKDLVKDITLFVVAPLLAVSFLYLTLESLFEKELTRDCSMTGTHIIDDNTIVVCQVLKIRQRETPITDKKPEINL